MEKRLIVRVPEEVDTLLEQLIARGEIKNKSDGVRRALKAYLKKKGSLPRQ